MLLLPSVFAALAVAVLGGPKRGKFPLQRLRRTNEHRDTATSKTKSHHQAFETLINVIL